MRKTLFNLVVLLAVAACGQTAAPGSARGGLSDAAALAAAAVPGNAADTSVPDAATVFAAQDRAAIAAAAPLPPANPASSSLSKTEESKAMPLPGQANDHSVPARERQLGK
jgi:hypothetical protein